MRRLIPFLQEQLRLSKEKADKCWKENDRETQLYYDGRASAFREVLDHLEKRIR